MAKVKIAIVQSNYIPWIGYFDLIASVDKFVFLDDVQYTNRDWRNRNKVIGPNGVQWLTVPINNQYITRESKIFEVVVSDTKWKIDHLEKIRRNYKKSNYFSTVFPVVEEIYAAIESEHLSNLNQHITKALCVVLGIETLMYDSRDFVTSDDKNLRLVEICQSLGASVYFSGPAAQNYLNVGMFSREDIEVSWFDYKYRAYPQLWGYSDMNVSIIDSMFNVGLDCLKILKED